jgi:predicted HTH transcriptional regulator
MSIDRTQEYLSGLVAELRKLQNETEWVEFKHNNDNPEEIGECLSALSNAAALYGKMHAYLIWGIADGTHEVVGTLFQPATAKKGNEELESWLLRLLNPRIDFRFLATTVENKSVVILEIPRASGKPVQFQGQEFIRIGSYRKKLKDYPARIGCECADSSGFLDYGKRTND